MTTEQISYIESEEFVEGARCLELWVPWMVSGAVHKLDEVLNKEDIVFEIGTGGSTLFFGSLCKLVVSVETNMEWANNVVGSLLSHQKYNCILNTIQEEDDILAFIRANKTDQVTVFSVDPQGGYNRSKILNAFLNKGISSNLRMIILDNYAHPGEFPDHHDKILDLGEGWEHFDYNHPRWAGDGTRIYIKKEK